MVTCAVWDIKFPRIRRPLGPKSRLRKWLQPRRDFNFYYNIGILLACLQENLLYWIPISELYIESMMFSAKKRANVIRSMGAAILIFNLQISRVNTLGLGRSLANYSRWRVIWRNLRRKEHFSCFYGSLTFSMVQRTANTFAVSLKCRKVKTQVLQWLAYLVVSILRKKQRVLLTKIA